MSYYKSIAQNCIDTLLGTKTLYKAPYVPYSRPPLGYEPVFINYAGRDGARHLTKDVKNEFACKLLLNADSAGYLTEQGKKLLKMVLDLREVEKGKIKSISDEGREELKGLGERMLAGYANVFKGNVNLAIAITKEIRTKQSADAFLSGLIHDEKIKYTQEEQIDDINLRFYDFSPNYKLFENEVDYGGAKQSIEKEENFDQFKHNIINRFFSPVVVLKLNDRQVENFISDIFGFTTIVYSLRAEIVAAGFKTEDLNFTVFFTCGELKALAMLDDAVEDLKKGPGTDVDGIQTRVAVPLLIDFIKTIDDFIKSSPFNAKLRFAHAETIAPVSALMNISTADRACGDMKNINKFWQASEIIPLSANIQWILYKKNGSSTYLIKILLNEKEAKITGMENKGFPYYQWNELRQYYIDKLSSLNVSLNDNMQKYLEGLKK